MPVHTIQSLMAAGGEPSPIGQFERLTAGSTTLLVPDKVYRMSFLCLQGGAGGTATHGGIGGDLRWVNNIAVVPGETLTIAVGAGGAGKSANGSSNNPGAHTTVSRGATVLHSSAFAIGAGVGGGNGGLASGSLLSQNGDGDDYNGGGGGGAGGYAGNGGNARGASGTNETSPATAGTGGAGGGGGRRNTNTTSVGAGGYGGGVGVRGQGANGAAAVADGDAGAGSSADTTITNGRGGRGGAWDATAQTAHVIGGAGGPGAFRAIWGDNRAFPSTNTGDMT